MEWNILQFLQSGALIHLDIEHVLVGYGEAQWVRFKEINPQIPAFYFPDFFLQAERPWLQFNRWEKLPIQSLVDELSIESIDTVEWSLPSYSIFCSAFSQLQNDFIHLKLQKAVPYAFSYSQSNMSPHRLKFSLAHSLNHVQKHGGYIYGFWHKDEGILGITPETLFQYHIKSNVLSTVALAGTCPKGACLSSFQSNIKEQSEHAFVIQGIKQALDSLGQVTIEKTRVLELPTLNHLMTPIQVKMHHPLSFEELVKVLHPTPALGAYPKQEGWRWLEDYQKQIDRKRYGAPVGVFFEKQYLNQCFVGIRNVQWDSAGMYIGSGCGVISSSQCEQEWKEINLKMKAIRECLAL